MALNLVEESVKSVVNDLVQQKNNNDMIADEDDEKSNDVSSQIDNFNDNILSSLSNGNKSNLILSPLSILIAMTLCMEGSANKTLKEMLSVLYPSNTDIDKTITARKEKTKQMLELCDYYNKEYGAGDKNKPVIKLANKIFIKRDYKVLDSYCAAVRQENVQLVTFNDKGAKIINDWCEASTNGMIRKIVGPDFDKDTRLLIANAIYFNGKFANKFPKDYTRKNTKFYSDKKRTNVISENIEMMYQFTPQYFIKGYKSSDGGMFDVVKLMYKGSTLSLILALPAGVYYGGDMFGMDYSQMKKMKKKKKKKVQVQNKNDDDKKEDVKVKNVPIDENKKLLKEKDIKSIPWWNQKLKLFVPKFKFEYETSLGGVLQRMGIKEAFIKKADFTAMTGNMDLKIGSVIHKAMIEVEEEGTKAAAVTVVRMAVKESCSRNRAPEPPVIRMDHPFSFYIFDVKKQIVLFSGVYNGA